MAFPQFARLSPSAKAEEIAPAPRSNQSHCVNGCDEPASYGRAYACAVRDADRALFEATPARRRGTRAEATYMPLGPRAMAAMPVRETSPSPSSVMIEMNCSILELRPVISNTKCSVEASMTL